MDGGSAYGGFGEFGWFCSGMDVGFVGGWEAFAAAMLDLRVVAPSLVVAVVGGGECWHWKFGI